jgi:hypothetical protein
MWHRLVRAKRMALEQLAEWISFERKCGPFFEFGIDVAPKSGPVWLILTGRAGIFDMKWPSFGRRSPQIVDPR